MIFFFFVIFPKDIQRFQPLVTSI